MYILLTGVVIISTVQDAIPFQQNINIVQGSDVELDGYAIYNDNSPVDITDSTINICVKRHSFDDGYGVINQNATIIDGTAGHWKIILTDVETDISPASYQYQVSYIAGESGLKDFIIPASVFNVMADLSEDN